MLFKEPELLSHKLKGLFGRLMLSIEWFVPMLIVFSTIIVFVKIYSMETIPFLWLSANSRDLLIYSSCCFILAFILHKINSRTARVIFLCLVSIYLLIGVGIMQAIMVFLFFSASYLYGQQIIYSIYKHYAPATVSLFVGLAFQVLVFGVFVLFPINYRIMYLVIELIPFAWLGLSSELRNRIGYSKLIKPSFY